MKKIVALLLAAVMVLSCLPVLAGSNTAQTKDKIDPNIKGTFKLDKTTLDMGKEDDKIVLTYNLSGAKGKEYLIDLYGFFQYEEIRADGTKKTNSYNSYIDYIECDGSGTYTIDRGSLGYVDKPTDVTVTLYVKGSTGTIVTSEDGTEDWEPSNDFFFFTVDPSITILGKHDEKKPTFVLSTDKKVYLPGEDITFSYEIKNMPSKISEECYMRISSIAYAGDTAAYVYEDDYPVVKDKGSFVFTAPSVGDSLKINIEAELYDDERTFYEWVKGEYSVALNALPPKAEDLIYNLPDINKLYLKKKAAENKPLQIIVTAKNADETVPTFTWTSDNAAVATVSADGVITPVSAGETMIKGVAKINENTYEHAFCVIVEKDTTPVTKIKPSKKKITLKKGKTAQINLTFTPATAFDTSVKWKTSDKKVATVKNGKITAKGKGKCVITVTMKDKKSTATCNIKVTVK